MNNLLILAISSSVARRRAERARLENVSYQVITASYEQFRIQIYERKPRLVIEQDEAQNSASPCSAFTTVAA